MDGDFFKRVAEVSSSLRDREFVESQRRFEAGWLWEGV